MGAINPLFMLVDDNDIDIFLNKKLLRTGGITQNIVSFQSANEALIYLTQHAATPEKLPPVILLDVLMPEVNGFQFLELFEQLPDSVKVASKIIMLSSTVDPGDLERARKNPYVIDLLKKPLDLSALIQRLPAGDKGSF